MSCMYGRLCDISTEESPIFLDVANAIFSINKVSEVNVLNLTDVIIDLNIKLKISLMYMLMTIGQSN